MSTRFCLAGAMLALASGGAVAADLPSRKAPAPIAAPAPPLWTGFYAGVNAGYTFQSDSSLALSSTSLSPLAPIIAWAAEANGLFRAGSDGFIGGGQAGYNYQLGDFVLGFEADFQGLATGDGGSDTLVTARFAANTFFSDNRASKSLDFLGTARGRVGYLATPTLLLYGTGGLAYGGVRSAASVFQFSANNGFFGAGATSASDLLIGWAAGGGAEWKFDPNWSVKLEYLRYDLGRLEQSFTLFRPVGPFAASHTSARFEGHVVRVGVNYHF
ncbi:outer membrane protein [Methylosinus sp. PW1]|uniref:outer membrane protein n=1 Tax=Methylosinus sp. PW1 TaxID=107636 RepID=UPI00055FBBC8|nr:outer membrane beta-barrel protein [Methylosinus sp. PW1]